MALNGNSAGDAVWVAIQAYIASLTPTGNPPKVNPDPKKIWETIMTAIYADIKSNGQVVSVGGPVESYAAGVGSHGGALVAGPNPVAGSVVAANLSGNII